MVQRGLAALRQAKLRPSAKLRAWNQFLWIWLLRFWPEWRLIGSIRRECLDHAIVINEEFSRALRSVFRLAELFAPPQKFPPGVFKFRSIEQAQAQRIAWTCGK
jgi:hypothetical protein